MPFTAKDLISAVNDVVSLPDIAVRVNEMVEDPLCSLADVTTLISQDPGLTARLLRIANSPFYGFPSRIDSVSRAITIIGMEDLRSLILATSAIEVFSDFPNELVSMETFWRHSLRCAVIARSLARHLHKQNSERYFTAGLLHDIGYLVIYRELPEMASRTLSLSNQNREIVYIIEQEVMGFDHTEVGSELLKHWNMPEHLVEAVRHHHTPNLAKNHPHDACIVHIANYLANTMLARVGGDILETEALDLSTLQTLGLTPSILQTIICEADLQFNDTLEIIVYDEVA